MLDFDAVRPFYPFHPSAELISLAQTLFAQGSIDPSVPLLKPEELSAVASAVQDYLKDGGAWFAPCQEVLRQLNDSLLADPARNAAALLLRHFLFEDRQPWESHIYAPRLLEVPGFSPAAFDLLLVTAALGYTLTVRKPPADLNAENVGSYIGYTRSYTNSHGEWGIAERDWNLLGSGGCMFVFNTLKFQPERFARDFLVLRNEKEGYCTLLRGEFFIASDGSITGDEAKSRFRTSPIQETSDAWIAHEVLPNGVVLPQARCFPKADWSVALDENSLMLGLHIPSQPPYTVENHRLSMQQAYDFYSSFLRSVGEIKGFVCYSWLYSAQNKHILPPDSRILEMQRCVHLCPMGTELDENLSFLRRGSSLCQRLADFRAAGNAYHVGYMYVPLEEARAFGEYRHEL